MTDWTWQMEQAAAMDISWWHMMWQQRGGKCPNCGAVFDEMHPAQNLDPHWTGACKDKEIGK